MQALGHNPDDGLTLSMSPAYVAKGLVGPNMLRYVDATIGCLRQAGFSYAMADHAWNALDAYSTASRCRSSISPSTRRSTHPRPRPFLPLIPPEQFPHLNGMSQEVASGRHDGLQHLELGLELLLEGLERMRKRGAAA